jgi:hypothetical protein
MVAAGHGNDRASFTDLNIRGSLSVNTTAANLSELFRSYRPSQYDGQHQPAARAALMVDSFIAALLPVDD